MKKLDIVNAIKEVLAEKKRPGLWANIRAKKARGEKPAHKNSNAHKDAVKAGKKINKSETKGAPAGHYFTKSGNLVKGTMSADARERGARKSDPKDKMRSKVPKATQYNEEEYSPLDLHYKKGYKDLTGLFKRITSSSDIETIKKLSHVFVDNLKKASKIQRAKYKAAIQGGNKTSIFTLVTNLYMNDSRMTSGLKKETSDPQDGKAAPYGSGYKKVKESMTRRDMVNAIREVLQDDSKEIVDDILSGINEGMLDGVLDKMKKYASKGFLTLAILSSVLQGLQAQGTQQTDLDAFKQQGIELVQQQKQQINKQFEKQNLKKVKKLLGRSFDKMNQLAQQTGTILVASKGNNLSVLKSMNQMTAKSHYTGSGVMASEKDQKVFKVKDGNFIVVSFYVITMNERTNPDAFSDNENLDIKN